MAEITPLRKREIVGALRNGTVPRRGIEHYAVGLGRFEEAIDEELGRAAVGEGVFKAVRGDYGTGKTLFARWLQHRAQQAGFATSEVQISATESPLHQLETIYRRALEQLRTREWETGAFRALVDKWFYALEEQAETGVGRDPARLAKAVGDLLESRLSEVRTVAPQFVTALRACHTARVLEDDGAAESLLAWLMGQPNIAAGALRGAGLKGDLDTATAPGFLRGLLAVLRETGRKGLLLVLDEVETIQRMRPEARQNSLRALRQLIDDLDGGRYPGLYVVVTGTPSFFEGPQGMRREPALEQRLHVDFSGDPRWESARAPQIRLHPFDQAKLVEVGRKVRDLYPTRAAERLGQKVDDEVIGHLASGVTGALGGKVGVAPRLFLRKLVGELLDKVEEHADYEPRRDYRLVVEARELTAEERDAAGFEKTVDDIALDLDATDAEP
jgi:hypothetical protein